MTDYNSLKVTELKDILKERGIPTTGLSRKAQIVEALEAHDASNGTADAAADAEEAGGEEEVSADVQNSDVAPAQQLDDGGVESAKPERQLADAEEVVEEGNAVQGEEGVRAVGEEVSPTQPAPVEQPSSPAAGVTVMEKNEPVSKEPSVLNTPQRPSPGAESQSSDTRKRKRRSPTPPPSEESVSKKLKAMEEVPVILPEDRMTDSPIGRAIEEPAANVVEQMREDKMVEDAPVAVDAVEGWREEKTVVPYSVSDDVMDVTHIPPSTEPAQTSRSPVQRSKSAVQQENTTGQAVALDTEDATVEEASEDTATSPAIHPATRTLYIRDLVRPLQPQQLRDHLIDIATPPQSPLDPRIIETFHLDTLRTHAFVTFTSSSAASRARSALHGRIWPDEASRKPLWVDFIPDENVQDWIDRELSAGSSRRDAKRWEVEYTNTADGVTATLQEALAPPTAPGGPMRQPSFSAPSGPGMGMPNAPLGPRASRPSTSQQPLTPSQPAKRPTPSTSSFDVLDQRFSFTTTKPKLYYLPVSKQLVDKRLDELDALTSRTWDGGRAMQGVGPVEGQLRRYTFEDGEKVVDNGPDIGSFGRGGGPPRGGRGRGGGYRGRW